MTTTREILNIYDEMYGSKMTPTAIGVCNQSEQTKQQLAEETARRNRLLVVGYAILTLVLFSVDLALPLGVAAGVPYISVVLLSLWHKKRHFTVMVAVLCSILTILGLFFSPPGGEIWKVLTNRALALFAIWVTTVLSLQRKFIEEKKAQAVREREEALAQIRILQGFLPICASCKKIRDDKGAWNQIEAYIRDHSEAEFSHGICPECAKKLYPEFYSEPQEDVHL